MAQVGTFIDVQAFAKVAPAHQPTRGQELEKQAFITLNVSGQIGLRFCTWNSRPEEEIWTNRTLQWAVNTLASGELLRDFLANQRHLFDQVHAGHSVVNDGLCFRGRLTPSAQWASDEIDLLLQRFEHPEYQVQLLDPQDFLEQHVNGYEGIAQLWPAGVMLGECAKLVAQLATDLAPAVHVQVGERGWIREVMDAVMQAYELKPGEVASHHIEALCTTGRINMSEATLYEQELKAA